MKATTVIIPAYNEAGSIRQLVERVLALNIEGLDVLVVDDASSDGTAEQLQGLEGVSVVRQAYNKGNGAAVKAGILKARGEWCLVIDADGQHDPDDIPRLLEAMENADMVVGARARDTEASPLRGFGNRVFCWLGTKLTGVRVEDMTCGLRVFRKEVVARFFSLYPNRFSFPTTSTMCLLSSGFTVLYIPIRAAKRQAGSASKIRPWRDGLKFLLIIARIVMFSPLKVFLPIGALFFGLGVLWTMKTLYYTLSLSAGGVLLLLFGVFFTFFGFMFDQIMALRKDLAIRDLGSNGDRDA